MPWCLMSATSRDSVVETTRCCGSVACCGFFAAAAERKRVAAFQAHDLADGVIKLSGISDFGDDFVA